ncbi:MAG: RsmD family RNA methyltransferase [Puniceicoccales bacterium]|jgi:16S rRNA (guanine966-N2)-methyltransferase|nr:RsmD family RNA methyltransferase [Puniceicoccales bacterium]
MRITGGQARGIQLRLPVRGEIRPATDYLREAVFSSLGAFVDQASVLDLFAGTGAYGLEAMSRGASKVQLIEKNPAAIAAIRTNIVAVAKACGQHTLPAEVTTSDALRWAPLRGARYDLIFCDPPWELWKNEAILLVERLATWTTGVDARIILEAPGEFTVPIPDGWQLHRHLAKGKNQPAASILRPIG